MDILAELNRIVDAKDDLADAIEEKGIEVPDSYLLDSYPNLVRRIAQGRRLLRTGSCGLSTYYEFYSDGCVEIHGTGVADAYGRTGNTLEELGNTHSPSKYIFKDFCTEILSVIVHDGITVLGTSFFIDCVNLTDVLLSKSLVEMGTAIFAGCTGLIHCDIPNGVDLINARFFDGCVSLKSVGIPVSVTLVSFYAFRGCVAFEEIHYAGTAESWKKVSIANRSDMPEFVEATLYCEYEEVIAKEEQEVTYPTITENGTYEILPEEGKVMSKATVEVDVKDADTVDGWHISVRDDGSNPPVGITNTLTFVYTAGG